MIRRQKHARQQFARRLFFGFSLLGLCLLSTGCFEKVSDTRTIGFKGEARVNPFFALEKLIAELGHTTTSQLGIYSIPDETDVLIIPGYALPTPSWISNIDRFLARGGHLIYLLGDRPLPWNGEEEKTVASEWTDRGLDPLLRRFKITESDKKGRPKVMMIDDEKKSIDFDLEIPRYKSPRSIRQIKPSEKITFGKADTWQMLSVPWQRGRLSIWADSKPLQNLHLDRADHAEILAHLLESHPGAKAGSSSRTASLDVLIVSNVDRSFYSLLWEHAWMPLVGFGVFTLLWLWQKFPRFGPIIPTRIRANREFKEHLKARGDFLWDYECYRELIGPLRRSVLKKVSGISDRERRAQTISEPILTRISETSDMPFERVDHALNRNDLRDASQMTNVVRDLLMLEETL